MLRFALIVSVLETACFWLFPRQILQIFGSGTGGYEDFAVRYMRVFMLLVILPLAFGIDGVLYTGPAADVLTAVTAFLLLRPEKAAERLEAGVGNENISQV